MNKLDKEKVDFIYKNYTVSKKEVRHFTTYICTYIYCVDNITFETYTAYGENEDEAFYNLFYKLPYSSVREGDVLVDDQGSHWVVKWDCGEKVQLIKKENESDGLEEHIMVYIYKGFGDMDMDYRKFDVHGNRTNIQRKDIPEHVEKIGYSIMVRSLMRQKNPGSLLNVPTKLIDKYHSDANIK